MTVLLLTWLLPPPTRKAESSVWFGAAEKVRSGPPARGWPVARAVEEKGATRGREVCARIPARSRPPWAPSSWASGSPPGAPASRGSRERLAGCHGQLDFTASTLRSAAVMPFRFAHPLVAPCLSHPDSVRRRGVHTEGHTLRRACSCFEPMYLDAQGTLLFGAASDRRVLFSARQCAPLCVHLCSSPTDVRRSARGERAPAKSGHHTSYDVHHVQRAVSSVLFTSIAAIVHVMAMPCHVTSYHTVSCRTVPYRIVSHIIMLHHVSCHDMLRSIASHLVS